MAVDGCGCGGLQRACTSVPCSLFPVKRGRIIDFAGRTRTEPPRLPSNLLSLADYLIITQTRPSSLSRSSSSLPDSPSTIHQRDSTTALHEPLHQHNVGLSPLISRANEGPPVGPQGKGQDMTGPGPARHLPSWRPGSRRPRGPDPPSRLPGLPLCPTGRSGRGRRDGTGDKDPG